jgi:hypothetical protein
MKRITLFCIFTFSSLLAISQHNGIGIRLGEPMAVTFKRYLPENKALEFMLGTAPNSFADTYYKKSFKRKYDDLSYVDHRVSGVLYVQGRYQFHYQIPTEGLEGKLDWYWGLGATFKTAKVEYVYKDLAISSKEIYYFHKTDIDLGPEVMAGLEFTLQNIPLAVFGEMSTFFELTNRPAMRVLGGIGARFNF